MDAPGLGAFSLECQWVGCSVTSKKSKLFEEGIQKSGELNPPEFFKSIGVHDLSQDSHWVLRISTAALRDHAGSSSKHFRSVQVQLCKEANLQVHYNIFKHVRGVFRSDVSRTTGILLPLPKLLEWMFWWHEGAAIMNNTFCLAIFLALVHLGWK